MASTLNQRENIWVSSVLQMITPWSGFVSAALWVVAAVAGMFGGVRTAGICGILAALTAAWAVWASSQVEQELNTRVIEGVKQHTPRTISPDQQDRMIEELKRFSGKEFTASASENDGESLDLLLTLIGMFEKAGLVFHPWNSLPRRDTGYGFVGISKIDTGVILHFPPAEQDTALELFSAFRFSQLKDIKSVPDTQNRFSGRLHLEVGKKNTML